jgi:hypothetical protein
MISPVAEDSAQGVLFLGVCALGFSSAASLTKMFWTTVHPDAPKVIINSLAVGTAGYLALAITQDPSIAVLSVSASVADFVGCRFESIAVGMLTRAVQLYTATI